MTVIAVSVSAVAIAMLYNTAVKQQTMRLSETVQSQARLLEAVARFDARFSREDVPGGAFAATLQQIKEAHKLFKGFGNTGEFTLAKREKDRMVYLFSRRISDIEAPSGNNWPLSVPLQGSLAEPMQQALMGRSGTIIGLDYRGVMVLAAFEPVAELDLGMVAKIDLAEIREPFLKAGLSIILITLILVILGTILVRRIGNPLIRELEENEQRLRTILDTAADGIITSDAQGVINSFNQAAENIFGYLSQEAIGQNITRLIAEPNIGQPSNDNEANKGQLTGNQREMTGLHKNGGQISIEITVSEVQVNQARLITHIVRDITERKQSLMELHQREEELRLTFENAPVGIYICSLDGYIQRANHALCMLLSCSEQEILNRPVTSLVHSNDQQQVRAHIDKFLAGQIESCTLEIDLAGKNANKIPCLLRASVIHDEGNSPQLCVVHIEDRSAHLKNELLIREHRERLAHLTRLSTMGEMAAGIAHEINQPLSAIATYAAACQRLLEREKPLPGEVLETLTKITNQALRAGEVIHRLREFIRDRKTTTELVACDALIDEVICLAEVDVQFHQVTIHTDVEPNLPSVNVDLVQIQQVILNLLRNAIEAMEKITNQQAREISLHARLLPRNMIEISVIDRGTGLSADLAKKLFTPFFTTKPLGMGLGLPISRSIINAHGGQLSYTPHPEGGSIFKFTLPGHKGD